jgi:hypothetical protein
VTDAERASSPRDRHISPLQLSMYVDGETPREERAAIAAHLSACPACSARLDAQRTLNATLTRLPRTTPSASVFNKVLEGARQVDGASHTVSRERLGRSRGNGPRMREVRLPDMDAPAVGTPMARRSRWRAPFTGALPTIAALLLIALTAGLLMRSSLLTSTTFPNTTPTATIPPGETLNVTQSEMARIDNSHQLSFTSVKPSYLPQNAQLGAVRVITLASGVYGLEATWTMSEGPLRTMRLREQPIDAPTNGYTNPAAQTSGMAWQLSQHPAWRAMTQVEQAGWIGVKQARGPVLLLLDAQPAPGASPDNAAIQLRLTSLSLDASYALPPITISAPPAGSLLRAISTVSGAGGQTWSWDVTSDAGAIQVNSTITAPDGSKITQITRSGAGVRLDWNHKVYQTIKGPTLYNPPPGGVTAIATEANTFLRWGLLWNLGQTNVILPGTRDSIRVYDLYRVDATLPEHVYADANTGAIVAIFVETGASISPGGPGGVQPYVSTKVCAPYTVTYNWIIFEQRVQSSLFNTTPPSSSSGWKSGTVPLPFTC